jgi:hypothetical protein
LQAGFLAEQGVQGKFAVGRKQDHVARVNRLHFLDGEEG